ncbi:hypothetical protein ACW4TU_03375 [Streptomyces sp. QTS52]
MEGGTIGLAVRLHCLEQFAQLLAQQATLRVVPYAKVVYLIDRAAESAPRVQINGWHLARSRWRGGRPQPLGEETSQENLVFAKDV